MKISLAKNLLWIIPGMTILFFPGAAGAVEITPFYTQNQSPLAQIFGLPAIGEATVVPVNRVDVRLLVDLGNSFIIDQDTPESDPRGKGETISIDLETHRMALDLRGGIARKLELGVQIPYLTLNGGFLDTLIEDFHSLFGFERGNRAETIRGQRRFERNKLIFFYTRNGKPLLNLPGPSEGPGDIRFTGGWQLYQGASRAVALRASLKVPSGDSKQLLGSGSTDLALWMTGRNDWALGRGLLSLFGGAGILAMTDGEVLRPLQSNLVWFGNIGGGWSPLSWLALKLQIDVHSPFFHDSALRQLAHKAALLTMGGTLAFSSRTALDIGVTEDIEILTSPDVVFHFALRHRF